jgi:16S rRNA (cytosine967-C5)-methyltransferase
MAVSPARAAAFDILLRLEREGGHASELLHSARVDKLPVADRALTTELVMGVLRWRSLLDAGIVASSSKSLEKLDAEVLTSLRLGAHQLRHLQRVPPRAAIHESVELVKRARKRSAVPFVNAVLRKLAATPAEKHTQTQTPHALAERLAHPLWLVERWTGAFGFDAARRICEYDQQPPVTMLRLRDATAEAELRSAGVELAPGALLTSARRVLRGDVTHTRVFREGRIYIQDEASQLVALLAGRGQRLLDCCAAPGGKTAILAERNPQSVLVAADLHASRLRTMRRLLRAPNVRMLAADAGALPFAAAFDRVLADVPCSGTGTLARHPEIKWRLRPEDLADYHPRQVVILRSALARLAPGGRLLYSTCSLEREENESVVEEVLSADHGLALVNAADELHALRVGGELAWAEPDALTKGAFLRTLPGVHPCDGFFAALLARL